MKLVEIAIMKISRMDIISKYLEKHYTVIDHDMGGILVLLDPESDTTYDVSTKSPLEVMPHDDTPEHWARAEEIKQDIILNAI